MIKNISKKKILAEETVFCRSILSKAKGLMFSKKIKDKGLVFTFNKEDKYSLHMLFVFFPIDVLWLDREKEVVWIKKDFIPFSLVTKPKEKAMFIIELPEDTINRTGTSIGDKISF